MRNKILLSTLALLLSLSLFSYCQAATVIRIAASINEIHQMNVAVNKVVGATWTPILDLLGVGMDFGLLVKGLDNVFRSDAYFVVDAPVVSNKASWTITHTRTDFKKDASNNLNGNVNVKFVKVNNTSSAETLLSGGYVSYANSNSKEYTSSDLTDSRLRIYYSIASGSGDASGVSVITTAKPTGTYEGTVTLTLSP
jgi:hypothetical protein